MGAPSFYMPVNLPQRDLKDLACLSNVASLPFFFFDLADAGKCAVSTSEALILSDLTISLAAVTSMEIVCPGWWLAQNESLQVWNRCPSLEVGPPCVVTWFSRVLIQVRG